MAREAIKLTEARKRELENMQEDIDFLKEEISKAEIAGLDVDQHKTRLADMISKRDGILKVYG